jgi:RNA 2',3'-cyclic 3'-phosphodiesterase
MGRTRTFIAVDVGDGIRNNVIGLQQLLAKSGAEVKWVTPESMHVTLVFLGEVDDRELHAVCRAVKEIAAGEPPFPLRVSGVGAFPSPRRPKIAWAGIVDGMEELRRLHAKLEAKMLDLGYCRKEEREYTPHLTLGRVKGEADGFKLAPELAKRLAWDGGRTVVDEVLVFSSVLEADGPIYTVLGRGKLTGKPGQSG